MGTLNYPPPANLLLSLSGPASLWPTRGSLLHPSMGSAFRFSESVPRVVSPASRIRNGGGCSFRDARISPSAPYQSDVSDPRRLKAGKEGRRGGTWENARGVCGTGKEAGGEAEREGRAMARLTGSFLDLFLAMNLFLDPCLFGPGFPDPCSPTPFPAICRRAAMSLYPPGAIHGSATVPLPQHAQSTSKLGTAPDSI